MRCGIYRRIRKAALCFTRQNVYLAYPVDLVAEKFNAESGRVRRGHHFDGISPCAELVPCEGEVVAIIIYRYQPTHKLLAGDCHSLAHGQNERLVFRGVAEGIYAGNARDDYNVTPFKQRRRCAVAETVDFIIYEGVLLNIKVAPGDIRLRLVIIVVRNKELHRIVGKKFLEFRAELRRQRLVVRKNERRTVDLFDYRRHGERFSRSRHADERLLPVAAKNAADKRVNRLRLVACRFIRGDELEFIHFQSSVYLFTSIMFVNVSPATIICPISFISIRSKARFACCVVNMSSDDGIAIPSG